MEVDGAGADEQLGGDVLVRHPLPHQLSNLPFLWRQARLGAIVAFANRLTGRPQLLGCTLGPSCGPEPLEHLECRPEVGAGVDTSTTAAQELAVGKFGASAV